MVNVRNELNYNKNAVKLMLRAEKVKKWRHIVSAVVIVALILTLIFIMVFAPFYKTPVYIFAFSTMIVVAVGILGLQIYAIVLLYLNPFFMIVDDAHLIIREGARYRYVSAIDIGKIVIRLVDESIEFSGRGGFGIEMTEKTFVYDRFGITKILAIEDYQEIFDALKSLVSSVCPLAREISTQEI